MHPPLRRVKSAPSTSIGSQSRGAPIARLLTAVTSAVELPNTSDLAITAPVMMLGASNTAGTARKNLALGMGHIIGTQ